MTSNTLAQQMSFVIQSQSFTEEDGLSSNHIYSLIEDNRGVIWVATNNGLNRFDGQNFKSYTTENGLEQNNIDYLYQDEKVIWCIHRNEETGKLSNNFTLFDTHTEEVISWKTYKKQLPFEKEDIIEIIPYDWRNSFMIQLRDLSYYAYLPHKGLTKLPKIYKEKEFFVALPDGCLVWAIDKNPYIRKIDFDGKEVFRTLLPFNDTKGFDLGFTYLGINNQNEILLNCINHHTNYTAFLKINEKGEITVTQEYKNTFKALNIPLSEYLAMEDAFYFVPKFQAFAYIYKNTFLLISFEGEIICNIEGNLHNNNSRIFYKSQQTETFWAGGDGKLHQIDLKQNHFINYPFPESSGFRGITCIDNTLYLNHIKGITQLPLNTKPTSNFSMYAALSSVKDNNNQLITSAYGVLAMYNPNTKAVIREPIQQKAELWALYPDKRNRIWYSEHGIFNYSFEDKKIREGKYNGFNELKQNTIYYFYEKQNGNLWLCTTSGLYEWHPDKGVIARYWNKGKGKFYIPTDDVRYLYFDKTTGDYWLASRQDGLIHWQPKTGKNKIFKFNRLKSNILHNVFADDFGYLWLSTEYGIIQFNKKTSSYQIYLPKDGTLSSEYNRIAQYQHTDGSIYFGSNQGITKIIPKYFTTSNEQNKQAKVIIVELNQYLNKTNKIENITATFYKDKQIKLQTGDRFFRLTLAIDQYQHSKNAYYQYQVKGSDKIWQTSKTNEISISGLPYGRHELIIKASLENGQFSEMLTIPIIVVRPFYLTWWFICLMLLLIISSTFFIIQWRTEQFKRQKKVLQIEVQKRTKKIALQTEKLKALDEAKSIFFANVSHELRTPITLIQGPINSILNHNNLSPQDIRLLKIAAQNSDNLLDLVNEILDLTKLENSELTIENTTVLLHKFIKRIISNFESLAEKKHIQLILYYDLNKDLQIILDQKKVEKVINNLISNALKFTPQNGNVSVEISNEDLSNNILIKIKDNGKGILKQDIPNVFNRFYQSSTNTKAEGGLGIGLSLSMEFVKLMKGKMWVESSTDTKNHGSTFFLTLPKNVSTIPVIVKETATATTNIKIQKPLSNINWHQPKNDANTSTILLVEDNLDLQEYILFLLSPYYKVVTAENGAEALNYLNFTSQNSSFPALIISDMMMPIMDGFEFLEKFKANDKWRSIPVIMLTARAELTNKIKALRIGVDDYIVKPFDVEELMVRIQNLLRNYEERQNYVIMEQTTAIITNTLPQQNNNQIAVITIEEDEIWLQNIEKIVIEQITNPLFSIDFLANDLNLNRNDFYRKVKQLTGLTPNQYVRSIRLKMAKDYLENKTYKTVKEIATQIGFQRPEYFSELYEREYGRKPSTYYHKTF